MTLDLDYSWNTPRTRADLHRSSCACSSWASPFPIVESPKNPNGFLGKPLDNKADTHLVVVSRSDGASEPVPFESWASTRTCTELVASNHMQVLPLGYMMLSPKLLARKADPLGGSPPVASPAAPVASPVATSETTSVTATSETTSAGTCETTSGTGTFESTSGTGTCARTSSICFVNPGFVN